MKMGRTCPVRPPSDRAAALPDEAGPSALGSCGVPNEGLAALAAMVPRRWRWVGVVPARGGHLAAFYFQERRMSGAHGRG